MENPVIALEFAAWSRRFKPSAMTGAPSHSDTYGPYEETTVTLAADLVEKD
ncbi:MAG: hypothetical protein JWM91_2111 [Rhodospirillales bacterium]|nr:hypothetical protein [Rhodospirillales bacterium]